MKLRLTELIQQLIISSALSLLLATTAASGSNTFSATGSMNVTRFGHKLILLDNGLVLAVTGDRTGSNTAELYNPARGEWSFTGTPTRPHDYGSATLLANSEVLLAGGEDQFGIVTPVRTAAAELYNPSTGQWTVTESLPSARLLQAAVLLTNGLVLVVGGEDTNSTSLASAVLYNPATGTWKPTASMHESRSSPIAELLENGTVLVAGGSQVSNNTVVASLTSAETYNPATGEWTQIANMPSVGGPGSPLSNGDVLVARDAFFDPGAGTWTATPPLPSHITLVGPSTATLLTTGEVLLTGFHTTYNLTPSVNFTYLYNSTTNGYVAGPGMTSSRYADAATLLSNGQVLVSGGYEREIGFGLVAVSSAELYTP